MLNTESEAYTFFSGSGSSIALRRPKMIRQKPLYPFDSNDPNRGDVATTLPPEFIIPTKPNIDLWIGDAWGVTLKKAPPYVPGANTTPREMVMSYQTHFYDRPQQDIILTEHCERGLTHLHLSGPGSTAEAPTDPTDSTNIRNTIDLFKYAISWGFYISYWEGWQNLRDRNWSQIRYLVEPFLNAIAAAGIAEKVIIVLGKELDSYNRGGSAYLDDIIDNVCRICNDLGIKVWLHFNANKPGWPAPGQNIIEWWSQWVNRVKGITWQADPYSSAGEMGARMWDTRKYLGAASLSLLCSAWELRGTQQLYGQCSEECGARTAWEMLCAPNKSWTHYPPVAGSMNGPRFPNGNPLLMGE